ncbi:hypothetical protein BDW71DRAFT_204855 [Aspergillus fruticulosus]
MVFYDYNIGNVMDARGFRVAAYEEYKNEQSAYGYGASAIDYLDVHLPPVARRATFRCLAVPDGEMTTMTTCRVRFSAHRDILCYWSRYFQGLSRHNWTDNEWVHFRTDIDPAAMTAVVNFIYTGTYQYQGDHVCRFSFLNYVRTIANYFLIDKAYGALGFDIGEVVWRLVVQPWDVYFGWRAD